jgi:Ca2+-binding RTX toxin-like protein
LKVEKIWGGKGDDHFFVDAVYDNHLATPVMFYGDAGNDILEGSPSDDILDGGEGDDILRGKGGNDKYVYRSGYGKDVIENLGKENGFVLLGGFIQFSEMNFIKDGSDLLLTFYGNQDDELRLKNYFEGHSVKGFVLDYDKDKQVQKILSVTNQAASENGIKLSGDNPGFICTLQQNDKIGGGDSDDMINAGAGDDEIIGYSGDDILVGGEGNDVLQGWQGDDVYVFRAGDGRDKIIDELYSYEGQNKKEHDGGKDTLRLLGGIKLEDLSFSQVGQDLYIKFGNNVEIPDSITIQKWFNTFNKVEFLEIEGVVHKFEDIVAAAKAEEERVAQEAAAQAAAQAEAERLAKEAIEISKAQAKAEARGSDMESLAKAAFESFTRFLPSSPNGFNKMDRSKQSKILQNLAKDLKCDQGHKDFEELVDVFKWTSYEEAHHSWSSYIKSFNKFEAIYGQVNCVHD